jgi:hypothetical protein
MSSEDVEKLALRKPTSFDLTNKPMKLPVEGLPSHPSPRCPTPEAALKA